MEVNAANPPQEEKDYESVADLLLTEDQKDKIFGEVYVITCSESGKQYVGQALSHKKNHDKYRPSGSERRFKDHICEAVRNARKSGGSVYLNSAIRKYGEDTFSYKVLVRCDVDEMDDYEIKYIKEFNTLAPNGYNLTIGGKGVKEWFNIKEIERIEMGINEPIKRGRDFGFKHKGETLEKMKKNHPSRTDAEAFSQNMKVMRGKYFDKKKVEKLAEYPLSEDLKSYIKPTTFKNSEEIKSYKIVIKALEPKVRKDNVYGTRLDHYDRYAIETKGSTLQESYDRLYDALKKAYELRKEREVEKAKQAQKQNDN